MLLGPISDTATPQLQTIDSLLHLMHAFTCMYTHQHTYHWFDSTYHCCLGQIVAIIFFVSNKYSQSESRKKSLVTIQGLLHGKKVF